MITLKLVGDLKGQGSSEGQVGDGEINHEDDGGSLGGGTEEEDPHGKAVSYQVDGGDYCVDDRGGDAGLYIQKQGQGGVVQLRVVRIPSHDQMTMASCHLCVRM